MSSTRSPRQRGERPTGARASTNGAAPDSEPLAPLDDEHEPLSLAEELAVEADRGGGDDTNERYERIKQGEIHIAELQRMSMSELIDEGSLAAARDRSLDTPDRCAGQRESGGGARRT